jgi:hypothetical protein
MHRPKPRKAKKPGPHIIPLDQRAPVRSFGPVGTCIYCGAKSYNTKREKLAKEHIVPHAFDGQLLLLEASCEQCEEMTKSFETKVLYDQFRPFRYVLKIKGKKRSKPRPLTLPLKTRDGRTVEIPVADHPALVVFPHLPPPRIIRNPGEDAPIRYMRVVSEAVKALADRHGVSEFHTTTDIGAFYRMLAKIAHAYVVAKWGLGSFFPCLLPIIRGESEDYSEFIGGGEPFIGDDCLWSVAPLVRRTPEGAEKRVFLGASIRLFGKYATPQYDVIAGDVHYGRPELLQDIVRWLQCPPDSTDDP